MARLQLIAFAAIAGSIAAACTERRDDAPDIHEAASASAGAASEAAATAPTESTLRGSLLRKGIQLDLAGATLHLAASRCRESRVPRATLRFDAQAGREPVLVITGDWARVKLGEKMTPRTVADSSGLRAVAIAAYVSEVGRGTTYTLPEHAWVRFTQLASTGAIAVDFDADFGPLGAVSGSARVSALSQQTCVVPNSGAPH